MLGLRIMVYGHLQCLMIWLTVFHMPQQMNSAPMLQLGQCLVKLRFAQYKTEGCSRVYIYFNSLLYASITSAIICENF